MSLIFLPHLPYTKPYLSSIFNVYLRTCTLSDTEIEKTLIKKSNAWKIAPTEKKLLS